MLSSTLALLRLILARIRASPSVRRLSARMVFSGLSATGTSHKPLRLSNFGRECWQGYPSPRQNSRTANSGCWSFLLHGVFATNAHLQITYYSGVLHRYGIMGVTLKLDVISAQDARQIVALDYDAVRWPAEADGDISMKGYKTVRRADHMILPERLRDCIYAWSPRPIKRLKRYTVSAFEKDASHDDIYDAAYYQKFVEPTMRISARAIAESVVAEFSPHRVVDVGCGTGVLLDEFRNRGVEGSGFELADAAIEQCVGRGLSVTKFDIEKDAPPQIRADLIISDRGRRASSSNTAPDASSAF